LYISSYIIAHIANLKGVEPWITVDENTVLILHDINVILAFCYLIVLASSFSKFHYDASEKINRKNLELKENKEELENLLLEKQTLLSETHHRVKNNLAVISGLFDLQLMLEEDPKLKSILTNSKNRIKSMSLIHESLYNQTSVSRINMKEYIESLTIEIQNSMQLNKKVDITFDVEPIYFDLSNAIPCGLIINEVISNCFKHAFSGMDDPKIIISLVKNEHFKLCINDNGSGFNETNSHNQNSLGLTLINALSKQLGGEYSFEKKDGTHFCLTFG
jgi:two-component sensor histidine kinase